MKLAPGLFAAGVVTLFFFSIVGGLMLLLASAVMCAIEYRKVPDEQ
jgi:hypothetical protein